MEGLHVTNFMLSMQHVLYLFGTYKGRKKFGEERTEFVSPLCTLTLRKGGRLAHSIRQEASLGDHNTVIDAEPITHSFVSSDSARKHSPLVRRKYLTASLLGHNSHHLL